MPRVYGFFSHFIMLWCDISRDLISAARVYGSRIYSTSNTSVSFFPSQSKSGQDWRSSSWASTSLEIPCTAVQAASRCRRYARVSHVKAFDGEVLTCPGLQQKLKCRGWSLPWTRVTMFNGCVRAKQIYRLFKCLTVIRPLLLKKHMGSMFWYEQATYLDLGQCFDVIRKPTWISMTLAIHPSPFLANEQNTKTKQ